MADTQRKQTGGSLPITRHPLFPAIVALWFGALFGLGSLAVRPGLIEELVVASGIDRAISAAAPPLGATARILIALTMTGLGGLLGAIVARRIARPEPRVRQRRHTTPADVPAGRSGIALSRADYDDDARDDARDDAGDGARDRPRPVPDGNKRRSLTMPEMPAPLQIHDLAPVPGAGELADQAAEIGQEDIPFASRPEIGREREPAAPLPQAVPAGEEAPLAPAVPGVTQTVASRLADAIAPAKPLFARAARNETPPAPLPQTDDAAEDESLASPMAADAPAEGQAAAEGDAVPDMAAPQRFTPPSGSAADRLLATDLDRLSPVELIERLAISMQRRRAPVLAPVPIADAFHSTPVSVPVSAGLSASEEPAAAKRPAAPVRPVPAMPAALRPLPAGTDDGAGEDDAEALSFIPLRHIPMGESLFQGRLSQAPASGDAAPPAVEPEPLDPERLDPERLDIEPLDSVAEPDGEAQALEEGYSSLLGLSLRPHQRQSFVRVEEPEEETDAIEPVVVFPGQGARPNAAAVGATPAPAPGLAAPATQTVPEPAAPATPEPQTAGRQFDNPAHAAAPATPVDKEEADRALRAALATLQRMSGAA